MANVATKSEAPAGQNFASPFSCELADIDLDDSMANSSYFEEIKLIDAENIRESWRGFVKMREYGKCVHRDDLQTHARRLENASWRLWHSLKKTECEQFFHELHGNVATLPDVLSKKDQDEVVKVETENFKKQSKPLCVAFSHSMERNGANNFVFFLLRELTEYRFEVISPKSGPMVQDFNDIGIPVHFLENGCEKHLLEQHLSKYSFAIINTIMKPDVVLACVGLRIPHLWVIHEAWPIPQIEHYAKEVFLLPHLDCNLIERAMKSVDYVVFPAKMQRDLYEEWLDPLKSSVIYNGIPMRAIEALRSSQNTNIARRNLSNSIPGLKLDRSDIVILHIGTVCKRKAQINTVQAFARLCTEHPELREKAKLLIVGVRYIRPHEIQYVDEIKAEIEKADLSKNVIMLDTQKNPLPFYQASDIVVCPSLNEVLPLVICEAMAFERPVICSRIAGIPECCTDNAEGFLIEAGDVATYCTRLERLVKSAELRQTMGAMGRKRVLQQFSMGEMLKKYSAAIAQCFSADRAPKHGADKAATSKCRVLVDMDNTLVDFDSAFIAAWRAGHPDFDDKVVRERRHFELELNFPKAQRSEVVKQFGVPGFFLSFKPNPGALTAIKEMMDEGIEVVLCTSTHPSCHPQSAADKFRWVEAHLGEHFMSRMIITRDKTLVDGDILLDDKPQVKGGNPAPRWKHVLFTQSYNRGASGPRINSWSEWRDALKVLSA
eukprot:CAMPEP_0177675658 /NCGR_PEP_ID=MMETSP0447-20121125/27327_1 /TAXON_ID=0 /ORGANISM="Stygamoeba regulata, Strain BSH-02190019" /LENGTH=719 /DNA_ID=CAMNT_0019184077 /DNA_START=61 /DNA_END=2220 /DNA_ORIENTATION=+